MKRDNLLDCHGMRFRAVIRDEICEGKITVESNKVYLCQNEKYGELCHNTQSYNCSWHVGDGRLNRMHFFAVSDFELLDEPKGNTIDDIQTAINLLKSNGYKVLKQDLTEL